MKTIINTSLNKTIWTKFFYTNSLHAKHLLVIKITELQVKQAECVLNYLGINDWKFYYMSELDDLISAQFDKVALF